MFYVYVLVSNVGCWTVVINSNEQFTCGQCPEVNWSLNVYDYDDYYFTLKKQQKSQKRNPHSVFIAFDISILDTIFEAILLVNLPY